MSSDINFVDYKMASSKIMFIIFDGRSAAPFFVWLFFLNWETFYAALITMALMGVLNMYKVPLDMAMRGIQRKLSGRVISGKNKNRKRINMT